MTEWYVNADGYEANVLYDVNVKVVERTPYSHPYNYDEYVKWKSDDFVARDCSAQIKVI